MKQQARNLFLAGKYIYLRPLEEKDLDGNYVSWLNNSEVSKNNSHHTFPYTYREGLEYIKNSSKSKDKIILAIILKNKNLHIGNISIKSIDPINRNGELAILIGEKKYWFKGYSKEACILLLKHCFDELNLNRVHCGTSEKNTGMQKLALFLGMTEEGRRRKAFFKNNEYQDVLEYGILRNEFYKKFKF